MREFEKYIKGFFSGTEKYKRLKLKIFIYDGKKDIEPVRSFSELLSAIVLLYFVILYF